MSLLTESNTLGLASVAATFDQKPLVKEILYGRNKNLKRNASCSL